jgi:hypothetical protein
MHRPTLRCLDGTLHRHAVLHHLRRRNDVNIDLDAPTSVLVASPFVARRLARSASRLRPHLPGRRRRARRHLDAPAPLLPRRGVVLHGPAARIRDAAGSPPGPPQEIRRRTSGPRSGRSSTSSPGHEGRRWPRSTSARPRSASRRSKTITFIGSGTTWLSGAPTFTPTGVSGVSAGSVTVVSNTVATVPVTYGRTSGLAPGRTARPRPPKVQAVQNTLIGGWFPGL